MKDNERIDYLFQTTSTGLLVRILKKRIDLTYDVKKELANRGLDKAGCWVGFKEAKKIHKIKS